MRIVTVDTWTEDLELTRPYTIAYERIEAVQNLFVRITCENGMVGLGAGSPAPDVTGEGIPEAEAALAAHLEALLVGADIRCGRALLGRIGHALADTPAARAAVDIALHDLIGNILGLPLVALFGRVHDTLPTSVTIGIKPLRETLDEAAEYIGRGFRVLKIKTGLDVAEDIERLCKLREFTGPQVAIRVDANQGYAVSEYRQFMRETEAADLEFVEQPLDRADLAGMRALPQPFRRQSAADEGLLSPEDALACLQRPLPFGIFNIKLMKCGGIAPGLEIASMAGYAGVDLMWGCMDESIVSIAAALHAALAAPATKYLDLDGSLDLARDIVRGGFTIENGCLRPTDRPGLGVTPL